MSGIGSHQSARILKDEWLTPPDLIRKLGPFDLDPCAPIRRPWETALEYYTILDNGLLQQWNGFVWMNPPYGQQTEIWMRKMANHNNGIALIFARTETKIFFPWVWHYAKSIVFLKGRLNFYSVAGERAKANAGAPSVLIAYGDEANERLRSSNLYGKYIPLVNPSQFSTKSQLCSVPGVEPIAPMVDRRLFSAEHCGPRAEGH